MSPQSYTWAQEKRIPAAKLGKEWRFKRSIIDAWFNHHIDEKFQHFVKGTETETPGRSKRK